MMTEDWHEDRGEWEVTRDGEFTTAIRKEPPPFTPEYYRLSGDSWNKREERIVLRDDV